MSLEKRPFLSFLVPLFQSEAKCEAIDMNMIFYSHANRTHFHIFTRKGLHLPRFEIESFWKSEIAYLIEDLSIFSLMIIS